MADRQGGPASYDVLISYAPADVGDAEWVAATIRAAGLSVYYDRDSLAPGESGEDAIIAALRISACVVEVVGGSGFESLGRLDLPSLLSKADRPDVRVVAVMRRTTSHVTDGT